MNDIATRIRLGDTKAIRAFIKTARSTDPAPQKWERLKMSKNTYYRVRAHLIEKGHTLDD